MQLLFRAGGSAAGDLTDARRDSVAAGVDAECRVAEGGCVLGFARRDGGFRAKVCRGGSEPGRRMLRHHAGVHAGDEGRSRRDGGAGWEVIGRRVRPHLYLSHLQCYSYAIIHVSH